MMKVPEQLWPENNKPNYTIQCPAPSTWELEFAPGFGYRPVGTTPYPNWFRRKMITFLLGWKYKRLT